MIYTTVFKSLYVRAARYSSGGDNVPGNKCRVLATDKCHNCVPRVLPGFDQFLGHRELLIDFQLGMLLTGINRISC